MINYKLYEENNDISLEKNFSDLVQQFKNKKIIVVGDYFLDRFVYYDNDIKVSIYSGGPSYSINNIVTAPGAAGTVAKNLSLLGVNVYAVGFCGRDGDGYELKKQLAFFNINSDNIIEFGEKQTPSYTMLMKKNADNEYYEYGECSVENRETTQNYIEKEIIERIDKLILDIKPNAIIFLDQLDNENYGVVTTNIRDYIKKLDERNLNIITYLDSRNFLKDSMGSCITKCNDTEFCKMFSIANEEIIDYCRGISRESKYPIVVTLGKNGTLIAYNGNIDIVPSYKTDGEIDTRGAGDAFTSGFVTSLSLGLSMKDAAIVGNAISSICISQHATTGFFDSIEVLNTISKKQLNYDIQLGLCVGEIVSSNNNDYKIISFLNKGKNGIVYYVECVNGTLRGIKAALKIQYNLEAKRLARFYLEVEFTKKQNNDHLLKYYDDGKIIYKNKEYCFIVFSYFPHTLSSYLSQNSISYKKKINFSYQLVKALCELKKQRLLHRDVKPQNILTDGNNIVLADYGLVKPVYSEENNFNIDDFWSSSNTMPRHYRTPELVLHAKGELDVVPIESDCFQAGLVICWLITGVNPLKVASNKLEPFEFIKVPNIIEPLGEDVKKIIESMIKYEYKKRKDVDKVLKELKIIMHNL